MYNLSRTDIECQWRKRKATNTLLPSVAKMFPLPKPDYAALPRQPTREDRSELYQNLWDYGKFTGLYWLISPEPQDKSTPLPVPTIESNIFSKEFLLLDSSNIWLRSYVKWQLSLKELRPGTKSKQCYDWANNLRGWTRYDKARTELSPRY